MNAERRIQQRTAKDPLPSWNDERAKETILDFVSRVTKEGGPDFVPVTERMALLLHHDDAGREFAHDRDFRLGPLVEALDRAGE